MMTTPTDVRGALGGLEVLRSGAVRYQHPLAPYTSFRVGGVVDAWVEAATVEEVRAVLKGASAFGVPWMILGAGSNVLVSDKGIRGIVMKLTGEFLRIDRVRTRVTAGSGVMMPGLAHTTAQWGLAGLECLVGIPGTVGGGLYMNAGVPDGEISDHLVEVEVIGEDGERRLSPREALGFAYRTSPFQGNHSVVASASFELIASTEAACDVTLKSYLRKRTLQPLGDPNLGSMFRNPPGGYAGQLIEEAGLKGLKRGGVQVSPKHANFFINTGGATAAETLALMEEVKRKVMDTSGVPLESEIIFVGEL